MAALGYQFVTGIVQNVASFVELGYDLVLYIYIIMQYIKYPVLILLLLSSLEIWMKSLQNWRNLNDS